MDIRSRSSPFFPVWLIINDRPISELPQLFLRDKRWIKKKPTQKSASFPQDRRLGSPSPRTYDPVRYYKKKNEKIEFLPNPPYAF